MLYPGTPTASDKLGQGQKAGKLCGALHVPQLPAGPGSAEAQLNRILSLLLSLLPYSRAVSQQIPAQILSASDSREFFLRHTHYIGAIFFHSLIHSLPHSLEIHLTPIS